MNEKEKSGDVTKDYYITGALKSENTFRDGKRNGLTRQYYENGRLMLEASFHDGKPDGIFIKYDDSGSMTVREQYKNGLLLSHREYDGNGKMDGIVTQFYESGAPKIKVTYRHGQVEGEAREFYEDGHPMKEEYYRNGILVSQKTYAKSGKLTGLAKEYYETGQVKMEIDHDEGSFYEYHRNGKIKLTGKFKGGKAEGLLRQYSDDGRLEAEDIYKKGELLGSRRYSVDGGLAGQTGMFEVKTKQEEQQEAPVPATPRPSSVVKPAGLSGIDYTEQEDLDGAISASIPSQNKQSKAAVPEKAQDETFLDIINTTHTEEVKEEPKPFFSQASVQASHAVPAKPSHPSTAGRNGVFKETYTSGALRSEVTYVDGKRDGAAKEYYEDGVLLAEITYRDDRVAAQTRYDKTGRFIYKYKEPSI